MFEKEAEEYIKEHSYFDEEFGLISLDVTSKTAFKDGAICGYNNVNESHSPDEHIDKSWFEPSKDDPNPELILKDLYIEGIKIIRHELVHAFILESGLSECCTWAENEELVDWIARQFPKMCKLFSELNIADK